MSRVRAAANLSRRRASEQPCFPDSGRFLFSVPRRSLVTCPFRRADAARQARQRPDAPRGRGVVAVATMLSGRATVSLAWPPRNRLPICVGAAESSATLLEHNDCPAIREGASFPFKSVYCDESGNSGPNLIDEHKPCYVLAGVLSPSADDGWLGTILDALRRDHHVEGTEFKGSRLLERAKGWRLLGDLLQAMGQQGGLPVYQIVEKRYAIAAKVVETYLDPLYNNRVQNDFLFDLDRKQDLAEAIHGLPLAALHDFSRSLPSFREAAALLSSLDALCSALRAAGRTDISILLAGARRVTDEIARLERLTDEGEIPGSGMATLNFPIFTAFLYQVEHIGRVSRSRRINIIHDESKEFAPTFQWWFSRLRRAAPSTFRFSNGSWFSLPLQILRSFKTVPSHTSPGVQAADLIARERYVYCPAIRGVRGGAIGCPPKRTPYYSDSCLDCSWSRRSADRWCPAPSCASS